MTDEDLRAAIQAVLRRYNVRTHYAASTGIRGDRRVRYAVWNDAGEQVTEPATHADAKVEREQFISADLLDLLRAARSVS